MVETWTGYKGGGKALGKGNLDFSGNGKGEGFGDVKVWTRDENIALSFPLFEENAHVCFAWFKTYLQFFLIIRSFVIIIQFDNGKDICICN